MRCSDLSASIYRIPTMPIDSSCFEGMALDPSKCSKLSMEEKRELVYEISKWSNGASEMLQSWSRQEILQILCAEMGKERKYTGLTKLKIIEHLLKIVSEKKSGQQEAVIKPQQQSSPMQRTSKRQRKNDHPSRLSVPVNSPTLSNNGSNLGNPVICKNSACKAALSREAAFCKRCTCCICYKYDDNKDPSLWLTCSSEPPFQGTSCGLSCHLECALKHERSGIGKNGRQNGLDGCYNCIGCGKINDLLGCWKKQLLIAKETRRVDILCYRVSLSQKLLIGAEKYQKVHEIVEEAVKKLETEVGPLIGLPVKMGRGIVNRLSSGPEVQKMCAFAVESLDLMLSNSALHPSPNPNIQDSSLVTPNTIRFEGVCATSLNVVLGLEHAALPNNLSFTLWHRMAHDSEYPEKSTCTLSATSTRFVVSGLSPGTEYYLKVVGFSGTIVVGTCEVPFSTSSSGNEVTNCSTERSQSPVTNSSLSNPSSVEDESNNITSYNVPNDNRTHSYLIYKEADKTVSKDKASDGINCSGLVAGGGTSGDPVILSDEEQAVGTINNVPSTDSLNSEKKRSSEVKSVDGAGSDNGPETPARTGMECVPFVGTSDGSLPLTPCRLEILKDGLGRNARFKSSNKDLEDGSGKLEKPRNGSTSKKRTGEKQEDNCEEIGPSDRDLEYYVKMIRWLEQEGHIDKNFRQKFLTWYSLRATQQEVRVVKVFVDTFIEDPASLAEQLMDTFSDCISNHRSSVVPAGFCMKLWH